MRKWLLTLTMPLALTKTEVALVAFLHRLKYDLVHVAETLGPRSFHPLCAPETEFVGDFAVDIPKDQPRCQACARKAKHLWPTNNSQQ